MVRGERYGVVAAALEAADDAELGRLVAAARAVGVGIGGTTGVVEVAGVPVFVKRVPLTERERLPEHLRSTADVFGLPAHCHYGVGGPGFGAWRELAAHTAVSGWVRAGHHDGFPLLYHARVLPGPGPDAPPAEELADVERMVAFWDGSDAVRTRMAALHGASASVTLFLEYAPRNLHTWMKERFAEGDGPAEAAVARVEEQLPDTLAFLNARGLLHFDAHFENVLVDGERLYLTDYGLTTGPRFALAADEAAFAARHRDYDRCYLANHLTHWVIAELCGYGREQRDALIARCARDPGAARAAGLPAWAAAVVVRHAPVAAVMTGFLREVAQVRRTARYPVEELRRALAG